MNFGIDEVEHKILMYNQMIELFVSCEINLKQGICDVILEILTYSVSNVEFIIKNHQAFQIILDITSRCIENENLLKIAIKYLIIINEHLLLEIKNVINDENNNSSSFNMIDYTTLFFKLKPVSIEIIRKFCDSPKITSIFSSFAQNIPVLGTLKIYMFQYLRGLIEIIIHSESSEIKGEINITELKKELYESHLFEHIINFLYQHPWNNIYQTDFRKLLSVISQEKSQKTLFMIINQTNLINYLSDSLKSHHYLFKFWK